tara:strand:- start:4379 stop:5035 length:657 start_codon:yes stop_codon:yes gene_type:complete
MKNRFIIGATLIIIFTTFISEKNFTIKNLTINEIRFENNKIVSNEELIKDLSFLYNKNIIFLNTLEIKKKLNKNSFIESLQVKKVYPNKLVIKIFEKQPIAIIFHENKKFFLGKKFELIKYKKILKYENLAVINGDENSFKKLFINLKKTKFPSDLVKKYELQKVGRWNIELIDGRLIKLPINNYKKSLKNFLKIKADRNFEKYKIFDYRLNNQLILK